MPCDCGNQNRNKISCLDRLARQKLRELTRYRDQLATINPYGNPYFADLDDPYAVQLIQQMNQFNNAFKSAEMPKKGVEKSVNALNSILNNLNNMITLAQNASNLTDDTQAAALGLQITQLGSLNNAILETGGVFNTIDYLNSATVINLYLPPNFANQLSFDLSAMAAMSDVTAANAVSINSAADAAGAIATLQTAIDSVMTATKAQQGLINALSEYQNTTGDQRTLLENNFKNWKDDRLCNLDTQITETTYN